MLYGTGRIFSIDHSWITLDGFTIDGQEQLADVPFPTDLRSIDAWKASVQDRVQDGRLVYIGSAEESRDLTGITISNMFLSGAGGECVRLRNNAHDNTITDSVIQYCGMYGKGDGGRPGRVPQRRGRLHRHQPQVGRPADVTTTTRSSDNVVARNIIRTFGSECFNVKENAHDNVFEDNVCSGNAESERVRGQQRRAARLRRTSCATTRSRTAPATRIKIQNDGEEYDKGGNVVENNRLSGAAAEHLQDQVRRESGPLLRQQHRRLRSAVQLRQRRHDAVGNHHPLLTRGPQRPEPRRRALRRAVAHVDGPAHLLCRL